MQDIKVLYVSKERFNKLLEMLQISHEVLLQIIMSKGEKIGEVSANLIRLNEWLLKVHLNISMEEFIFIETRTFLIYNTIKVNLPNTIEKYEHIFNQ